MNFYKGVDLDRNSDLFNYINTFHPIDSELRDVYMESDRGLQRLVRLHHLKISLYKIAFNLSVYALLYVGAMSLTGCVVKVAPFTTENIDHEYFIGQKIEKD